ncbi:MAG: hypothetical protein K2G63_01380 [Oscillospiraceae bacterium]|nr:hypothetical protein [Oscillospiraceae bacterium]
MYEYIPKELKDCPNWVCWKSIPDASSHSGIKKIPINPKTGGQAMSNNPQTWSNFEIAIRESKKYSGIGFMFTNSGYFGVDLDDCRNAIKDYNNGDTDNIVYEFIYGLQSYSELSQSGNGIHIICKGTLPPSGRRKGKVEMYDKGRFFIMTGASCSEFAGITDCTERIKQLHTKYLGDNNQASSQPAQLPLTPVSLSEQEIISKAMKSQHGEKFTALYKGDISDYPSQSEADMAFCNLLAFWCRGDTQLMDRIYRNSGLMRDKWDRKQCGSTYGMITLTRAVTNCKSFYNPQVSDNYSIAINNTNPPVPSATIPMHTLDDTGNAQRMSDLCGNILRYCYIDKRWLYYQDGKWQYDDRGIIYAYADLVLDRMKQELKTWTEYEGGNYLQDYQKHMKRTRSNAAKRAMVKEFEHIVAISPSELDTHKTLVNSQSGVLNLDDCTITPHNHKFYMTRILGTSMPLHPKRPVLWLSFLDDIFNGDKELIRYVQKALGYSLSGLTSEQCVFFLYGTGRNGKSTFLEVVRAILGEYATNIQPESIMMKSATSTANTDIARLKGARLVTSVEPNEGMRLNEGLLKQLTGDDVVTARKLYGDEFEYRPEFKLWMATNHKPTIRGTDIGIWRRIHIIPFTVTIPEDKIDKDLGDKLTEELPDILAWMMEGYRLWKYEGLNKPKIVLNAVKEYRNEMDVISAFLDSDYVMEGGEVKSSVLYAVYCQWASENNEYKMPSHKFSIEMSKRYNKVRKSDGFYYQDISINSIYIIS